MGLFITDGNQRSTLAAVRAIGRAGVRVTVGETVARSLAGSSRYCTNTVCYPSPVEDPKRFVDFLVEEMRLGGYRVLLPMTDVAAEVIARHREALSPFAEIPMPDWS